jgi:hypothetical protein
VTQPRWPPGPGPKLRALLTAVPVVAWLAAVEVGLRTTSLSRLTRLLGVAIDTDAGAPGQEGQRGPVLTAHEGRQLRILAAIVERWPFGRGPCLRQSLVAGRILRRHQPHLRIGAAPTEDGVLGHAWLELAGKAVVGNPAGFPVLVSHG